MLRVQGEIWRVALLTCKLRKYDREMNQDKENENPTVFTITVTTHRGFRWLHLTALCAYESRYYCNDSIFLF